MATIRLPPTYYTNDGEADFSRYIDELVSFLASPFPSSIVEGHPNGTAIHGPPKEWEEWWNSDWIDREGYELDRTLKAIVSDDAEYLAGQLPPGLCMFLQDVHRLTLPRKPDPAYSNSQFVGNEPPPPYKHTGMSVKKAHEIEQLSSLIWDLAQPGGGERTHHVVDAGSGQGYLARALASRPYSFHVLALDSDDLQIQAAEHRGTKKGQKVDFGSEEVGPAEEGMGVQALNSDPGAHNGTSNNHRKGSITHCTTFLDSKTLPLELNSWIPYNPSAGPVPVLVTGLHACGSLTPAVIRAVISMISEPSGSVLKRRGWYCSALAIVGCCYNRTTREDDYPLSSYLQSHQSKLRFDSRHLQLAAQTPSTWPNNWDTARFGLRKVAMRALLGKYLTQQGLGDVLKTKIVGRLNDKVFSSWSLYYSKATAKLGIPRDWNGSEQMVEEQLRLVRRLEFFHVLRCMLGPVIESLILMDRWLKLKEDLEISVEPSQRKTVRMVNVFDQSTGSVRNVALVVGSAAP